MFSLNIAKWVYDIADCCYHDASYVVKKKKRMKKEAEKDESSAILYRLFICMGRITENK